jgi:hypothetical protein
MFWETIFPPFLSGLENDLASIKEASEMILDAVPMGTSLVLSATNR